LEHLFLALGSQASLLLNTLLRVMVVVVFDLMIKSMGRCHPLTCVVAPARLIHVFQQEVHGMVNPLMDMVPPLLKHATKMDVKEKNVGQGLIL